MCTSMVPGMAVLAVAMAFIYWLYIVNQIEF
jgi:hypothetical protein